MSRLAFATSWDDVIGMEDLPMKLAIALSLALMPSFAFADECLLMKDSRHVYDFGGDAITIVGKECETSATRFINDIASEQVVTCKGMKHPVAVFFNAGDFFSNENGKEERLVEACGS